MTIHPPKVGIERIEEIAGKINTQNEVFRGEYDPESELFTSDDPVVQRMGMLALSGFFELQMTDFVEFVETSRGSGMFNPKLQMNLNLLCDKKDQLSEEMGVIKPLVDSEKERIKKLVVSAKILADSESYTNIGNGIEVATRELGSGSHILQRYEDLRYRQQSTQTTISKLSKLLELSGTEPISLTADKINAVHEMMEYSGTDATSDRNAIFLQSDLVNHSPRHKLMDFWKSKQEDNSKRIADFMQTSEQVITFETLCTQFAIYEEKFKGGDHYKGSLPYQLLLPESASAFIYAVTKELKNRGLDLHLGWLNIGGGSSWVTRVYSVGAKEWPKGVILDHVPRSCEWDDDISPKTIQTFSV